MLLKALKSKIHRATITGAEVDYPGSVAIDAELLEAAGILPYEVVLLADVTNGERLETYVVPAARGSGQVIVMGAAARKMEEGDIVIIMNFALFEPHELKNHKPRVLVMDEKNHIRKIL
jgi:aspartate 1-decarboxylase